jgi:hypothetical protein
MPMLQTDRALPQWFSAAAAYFSPALPKKGAKRKDA